MLLNIFMFILFGITTTPVFLLHVQRATFSFFFKKKQHLLYSEVEEIVQNKKKVNVALTKLNMNFISINFLRSSLRLYKEIR